VARLGRHGYHFLSLGRDRGLLLGLGLELIMGVFRVVAIGFGLGASIRPPEKHGLALCRPRSRSKSLRSSVIALGRRPPLGRAFMGASPRGLLRSLARTGGLGGRGPRRFLPGWEPLQPRASPKRSCAGGRKRRRPFAASRAPAPASSSRSSADRLGCEDLRTSIVDFGGPQPLSDQFVLRRVARCGSWARPFGRALAVLHSSPPSRSRRLREVGVVPEGRRALCSFLLCSARRPSAAEPACAPFAAAAITPRRSPSRTMMGRGVDILACRHSSPCPSCSGLTTEEWGLACCKGPPARHLRHHAVELHLRSQHSRRVRRRIIARANLAERLIGRRQAASALGYMADCQLVTSPGLGSWLWRDRRSCWTYRLYLARAYR